MSQIRKLDKFKHFCLVMVLYFSSQLVYANIAIDPAQIILSTSKNKTNVKLYNNSKYEYVYRSGVMRRQENGGFYKESELYLIYPPVGILKSNSSIELGLIKMKNAIHKVDEKIYLCIQLIPKEKEVTGKGFIIPLTVTVMVEIKSKE